MIDTIAVVGATGAVGRIIVESLLERQFPARRIKLLASPRSAGRPFTVAGADLEVEVLRPEAFDGVQIAIGSTPDEVSSCPGRSSAARWSSTRAGTSGCAPTCRW